MIAVRQGLHIVLLYMSTSEQNTVCEAIIRMGV